MNSIQDIMPRFTEADADRAYDDWGSNCGPAALAVVAGMTLEQVRPHLGDFEAKRYTNPTLMFDSLKRLGLRYQCGAAQMSSENQGLLAWPSFGLARIQWEGPWTQPGVPIRARYRYTHWVASCVRESGDCGIFDVNCLNNGSGWVGLNDWASIIVPHLLKAYPRATGRWHITHSIEVQTPELSTNCPTSARPERSEDVRGNNL